MQLIPQAIPGKAGLSRDRAVFPGNWLWCTIAVVFAIDGIWLAASQRLSVTMPPLLLVLILAGFALTVGLRRSSIKEWIRDAAVGAAFIMLSFVGLKVLDYLLMSTRFPLADDLLDSWDRALGFNWLAYATAAAAHEWTTTIVRYSYVGLSHLTVVLFVLLFYFKGAERAGEYVRLFFICAATATVIGAFFPRIGVMVRYASPELADAFGPGAGTYYIEPLLALRSDEPFQLNLRVMPGLVEFPSFRTASAILVAYVCRGMGWLSWLAAVYAAVLTASTPLMGGHYFVDLIAGTILAVGAAAIEYYLQRRPASESAQAPIGAPSRSTSP